MGVNTQMPLTEVSAACIKLRGLRSAAGRALLKLWKGEAVDLGAIDTRWLAELVERIRREIHVYEIESLSFGHVPNVMLGWWIPSELAHQFEMNDEEAIPTQAVNEDSDDDNP